MLLCPAFTSSETRMPVPLLAPEVFLDVVRHAPLVSMDLIVQNSRGEFLVGLRTNPPARNYWFVPGGRIRKDESMVSALRRIAAEELDLEAACLSAQPAGVFEHFYDDNFAGIAGTGTHYVVLAYRMVLPAVHTKHVLPHAQHCDYRWLTARELLAAPDVHPYSKQYFAEPRPGHAAA
jgi:colanic acid biosynthesis protein WcaH